MTAASAAAQSSGAAFEAWVDGQHRVAKAAGHLVWVDHYGPEVQHLSGGAVRVVGHAPPDYLGQLRGGRVVLVEAKRRTGRLAIEGTDRDAIIPHQAARLADAEAGGAVSLVLVEFERAAGVKPVALMRWLLRLITEPGDIVLDPFGGSGTTGVAALAEGRRVIIIERDPAFAAICRARLSHAAPTAADLTARVAAPIAAPAPDFGPLFGGAR